MAVAGSSAEVDAPIRPKGAPPCPNCGSTGLGRYCPNCGQAAPDQSDYSLGAYAADLVNQVTNSDGKAIRTVWTLIAKPGVLTVDHLDGRRARYLRPLQLFLLVNVLLFIAAPQVPLFSYSLEKYLRHSPPSPALAAALVQRATPHGHTHEAGEGGTEFEAYAKAFDARVEVQRKSFVILLAPALALLLWLLFIRCGRHSGVPCRYGEHLVFVLHVLAFTWLVLAGVGGIVGLAGEALVLIKPAHVVLLSGVLGLLLIIPLYLLRAVRRVYRLSWPWAVAVTCGSAAFVMVLLVAYRGLLFFTTYYTL